MNAFIRPSIVFFSCERDAWSDTVESKRNRCTLQRFLFRPWFIFLLFSFSLSPRLFCSLLSTSCHIFLSDLFIYLFIHQKIYLLLFDRDTRDVVAAAAAAAAACSLLHSIRLHFISRLIQGCMTWYWYISKSGISFNHSPTLSLCPIDHFRWYELHWKVAITTPTTRWPRIILSPRLTLCTSKWWCLPLLEWITWQKPAQSFPILPVPHFWPIPTIKRRRLFSQKKCFSPTVP